MKYVYCLAKDVESTSALPSGLGGMKVYQVSFKGIDALVSDMDSTSLLSEVQNALVHQKVVQGVLEQCTSLIPCRFGTLLADEEKILSLLKEHHGLLKDELQRLENKLEVSIRAVFDQINVEKQRSKRAKEPKGKGIKYLLEKKRRFDMVSELSKKADNFNRKLNSATKSFWTEVKEQKRSLDNGLLLSIYYLIDKNNLSSFKCSYQQFKEEHPELNLLYTGPWPPYSFTDINLSDDEHSTELNLWL